MSFHTLLVFAHVLAATVLVGSSLLLTPVLHAAVRRALSPSEIFSYLAIEQKLGMVNPLAAMLVIVTGGYLTLVMDTWREGWIGVACFGWVTNLLLAVALVRPAAARLATMSAGSDGSISGAMEALREGAALRYGAAVMLANDLATLLLMIEKSGWYASITVLVATNVVICGFYRAAPYVARRMRVRASVARLPI